MISKGLNELELGYADRRNLLTDVWSSLPRDKKALRGWGYNTFSSLVELGIVRELGEKDYVCREVLTDRDFMEFSPEILRLSRREGLVEQDPLLVLLRSRSTFLDNRYNIWSLESKVEKELLSALRWSVDGDGGMYVARRIIMTQVGPEKRMLVFARERRRRSLYSNFKEVPGGKLEDGAIKADGVSGEPYVVLADFMAQIDVEMKEEMGDLGPLPQTWNGFYVSLLGDGQFVVCDVTELSVVSESAFLGLLSHANTRRDSENLELRQGGEENMSWQSHAIVPGSFLPSTAFCLHRLRSGDDVIRVGQWRGVSVFVPYNRPWLADRGHSICEMGIGLELEEDCREVVPKEIIVKE